MNNRNSMTIDEKINELHGQLIRVESVVADILIRVAMMDSPQETVPNFHIDGYSAAYCGSVTLGESNE